MLGVFHESTTHRTLRQASTLGLFVVRHGPGMKREGLNLNTARIPCPPPAPLTNINATELGAPLQECKTTS